MNRIRPILPKGSYLCPFTKNSPRYNLATFFFAIHMRSAQIRSKFRLKTQVPPVVRSFVGAMDLINCPQRITNTTPYPRPIQGPFVWWVLFGSKRCVEQLPEIH